MSNESAQKPCVPPRSARMRAVGDIMFCKGQLAYARNSGGSFYNQFEMIGEQLADADFTMGNLEGTIGQYRTIPFSGYPRFNAPEAALAPLRDCGVDLLTLANNHMGNFISDHILRYTDNGVILDFTVNEQPDGRFTCDRVGYIPTYTWKQDGAVRVLPSGKFLENRPIGMDDRNYSRMIESCREIKEVMGNRLRLING